MRRTALAPLVAAALLGGVWLNQGVSHKRATALLDSLHDPWHQPLDGARYVVTELYERTGGEEIDFAVANATRGLPFDRERLLDRGRDTPWASTPVSAADGQWHRPYAEVPFEYPVAMILVILLPSLIGGSTFAVYSRVLAALMTAALLGAAALARRPNTRSRGWALPALMLAQGSLVVQSLDAVPALLLAWTVWAAARRKPATTGLALGLATAAKLFPLLLVPLVVAADRDGWRSTRARVRGGVALSMGVGLGFAPMLFPPGAFLDVLRYHAARGLHVESTAAALLRLAQLVTGTVRSATLSYGSYNLDDPSAAGLARLCTPLMLVLLALTTVCAARAPLPRDEPEEDERLSRIAGALLAGLAVIWLSAKVFSPQYLTWAIPLVLMVTGARGERLTWLLFVTMALTQVYMRAFYGQVIEGSAVGVAFLIVRLPLLVAFAVTALRGAVRGVAREVEHTTAPACGSLQGDG